LEQRVDRLGDPHAQVVRVRLGMAGRPSGRMRAGNRRMSGSDIHRESIAEQQPGIQDRRPLVRARDHGSKPARAAAGLAALGHDLPLLLIRTKTSDPCSSSIVEESSMAVKGYSWRLNSRSIASETRSSSSSVTFRCSRSRLKKSLTKRFLGT